MKETLGLAKARKPLPSFGLKGARRGRSSWKQKRIVVGRGPPEKRKSAEPLWSLYAQPGHSGVLTRRTRTCMYGKHGGLSEPITKAFWRKERTGSFNAKMTGEALIYTSLQSARISPPFHL